MQELTDTLNNGETEVLVVPKGEFYGSDSKGNPIPESIDEKVIDNLEAQLQGKELLVDKDHSSMKEGSDKDTSAMGWMHSFKKGVEGLWAKIQWTNIGRNLVENRVFRFLSPVFTLKGDKPTNMLNVALTNQPAFQEMAKPIINNQPTMETITMEMTKEELIQLIKDTIADMKKEEAVQKVEDDIKTENEIHEDIVENLEEKKEAVETGAVNPEDVLNSQPKTEEDKQVTKNACSDEVDSQGESIKNECGEATDEVKNEEVEDTKDEDEKEDTKDEDAEKPEETDDDKGEDKEEEKEEVIKIDALNSAPKTFGLDIVQNTGKEQPRYPGEGYAIVKKVC